MKSSGNTIVVYFILILILDSCVSYERDTFSGDLIREDIFSHLDYAALEVNTGVQCVPPVFRHLYSNAEQLPSYGEQIHMALLKDSKKPASLFYHTFRMLGTPAGGYGPPLSGSFMETPLISVLEASHFEGKDKEQWDLLPEDTKDIILGVIQGIWRADNIMQQFRAAFMAAVDGGEGDFFSRMAEPWEKRELHDFSSMDLLEHADMRKLSFASRLLTSALSPLISMEGYSLPASFDKCTIHSPVGKIALFGQGRDTIEGSYVLIIDFGGDDLYRGRTASPLLTEGPIAVVVDLGGDDTYQSGDDHLVTGCLGISLLMDMKGQDSYFAGKAGLASACYGSSMLFDFGGDDSYTSDAEYSQGAAHLGSAVLADLEGEDVYSSKDCSQGYGGTLGVGLLIDIAGDDRYNQACPEASFVQGASKGRWAEASDGHSLGGGMGIFMDAAGDDEYYGNSFSQGASYFVGTGLFFDLNGDDSYQASSHSQGYSAHFALAGFFEKQGDDSYNSNSDFGTITQILGGGRDLSAAWFIEESGDDSYHFGNRSAGVGDLNGVGVLWDKDGTDTFTCHENRVNAGNPSLGQTYAITRGMATSPREFLVMPGGPGGVFRDDQKSVFVTMKNE